MKNNLLVLAQSLTVISILFFLYFQYLSYTKNGFSGLWNGLLAMYIGWFLCILIIWWSIYYGFFARSEFSHAYLFFCLCLVVISSFMYLNITTEIATSRINRKAQLTSEWRNRLENREYISQKLGISFQYTSEVLYYGPVIIKEEWNTIILSAGNIFISSLQKLQKDKNMSLSYFLRKKYGNDYPNFIPREEDIWKLGGIDTLLKIPQWFSSLRAYAEPFPKDINIPENINPDIRFMVDEAHPDIYFCLILSTDKDIFATKERDLKWPDWNPTWSSTVRFVP